jgi:adenylate kinase
MRYGIYLLLFVLIIGGFGVYAMRAQSVKPEYYVLIGPPGSGKGTLADKLSKHVSLPVLTVSSVLKQNMQKDKDLEKQVKDLMAEGKFVSDAIINQVLVQELQSEVYVKGVIFDGFPRTLAQTKFFAENNIIIDTVIVLDVNDEDIIQRMQGRRVHLASGRVYHVESMPPKVAGKDDLTGEDLVQR